jgi:predicted ribosomally synthesized peptide with SipW-like signal peptide
MKKNKILKTLGLFGCAILLVAVSIAGTVAYLTSTDSVKNTFTVGKVAITMDETDVDEYGVKDGDTRVKANEYKLIPGHKYVKDPTITVKANSEKCYLFVKIENGIASIEAAGETAIVNQLTSTTYGWTAHDVNAGIYYKVIESATTDQTVPVFGSFKLADTADVSRYADAKINVTAYAIQFEGMADVATAWNTVSNVPTNP